MKRKPLRSDADVRRMARTHVRGLLKDGGHLWRQLRIRSEGNGIWTIDRPAGGASPVHIRLSIELAAFPPANRLAVDLLVRLLVEQAAFAALFIPLAGGEAQAGARRERGGQKTAGTRRDKAADRDKRLLAAARRIRMTEPRIKNTALAAMLADQGLGGKDAIRKKLASLLRKKSVEGH